jgi:LysR family hydrogen peroxide-inducible transcriptional activator
LSATPHNHSLAKLKTVQQHDLDNKNLPLLEEGHGMREQALALCQKLNANETQNFRATSLETLRHMIAAGVGITLMPKLACNNGHNIAYVPFSTLKPVRSIGLTWRSTTIKSPLLEEIAIHIKKIMKKQKSVKVKS